MTPARTRTLTTRTAYENPWMRVREDTIALPDGSEAIYGVVEKPPFALVVPFDGERFHLVGQWRHPLGRFAWELPQGSLRDRPDAPLEEVARTELREETGLVAAELTQLGRLDVAAGFSAQHLVAFLATGLTRDGEPAPEPEEVGLTQRAVTRAELEELLRTGAITDQATVAAYGLLLLRERGRAER